MADELSVMADELSVMVDELSVMVDESRLMITQLWGGRDGFFWLCLGPEKQETN
jgi:hypothetical protein